VWVDDAPDGNTAPINTPQPILAALGITVIGTFAVGIYPQLVARFGELQDLTGAFPG
jgi:NADH-quinone oxidoreductase subunit N